MYNILYEYHNRKYDLKKEDKIKLIYQGIFGPNHLGSKLSFDKVYERMSKELTESFLNNQNIYEWISQNYLRVNIHKYVEYNFSLENLINSFLKSSEKTFYDLNILRDELLLYLTNEELADYNYLPISHSDYYRNKYYPHYLVVEKDFLTFDLRNKQLINYLKNLPNQTITAIEGRAASGKTTLTENLENEINNITVIHADSFFLPQSRKTVDRMNEVGGNIDYELIKETLLKIKEAYQNNTKELIIKTFDCSTGTYNNNLLELKDKVVIEGVYSYHNYFNELINYLVFVNVDKVTQEKRINQRTMKDLFFNLWLPLEERYYLEMKLEDICDIII